MGPSPWPMARLDSARPAKFQQFHIRRDQQKTAKRIEELRSAAASEEGFQLAKVYRFCRRAYRRLGQNMRQNGANWCIRRTKIHPYNRSLPRLDVSGEQAL